MAIKSNDQGFLIGERQLKEMSQGITKTEVNTRDILKALENLGAATKAQQQGNQARSEEQAKERKREVREASSVEQSKVLINTMREVRDSVAETTSAVKQQKRVQDAEHIQQRKRDLDQKRADSSVQKRIDSARDAKGRFVGGSSDAEQNSQNKSLWRSIKGMFDRNGAGVGGNAPDVRGYDPTIDALSELKDVVAPVGGVFGRMSAKAKNIFSGRIKRRKNEEVVPEEQTKANKQQHKNDTRRNTLLVRLIDAVNRQRKGGLGLLGAGRGGGLLGALLGGGKALLKRVPIIGALFGGGMLAKDWGKMDSGEKGKGLGKLIGTAVGGAIGSIFTPAGTVAGGAIGYYLGGIFGEKVGQWTDSLKRINIAEVIKDAFKSVFSVASAVGSVATAPARAIGSAVGGAFGRAKDFISEKIGFSGGEGSLKTRDGRQLGMYNALRKAGFSKSQALAIGGEIGRENDYGDAMFSTHIDPAKDGSGRSIKNGGVLSWNRERYKKFSAFMQSKGLMDANGQMSKSQETLDAQAEFIKKEMTESYGGSMKGFLENKDQDPKQAAASLAKYIGWARGQTSIRGANGTRVAFDSGKHERKINGYIDKGAVLVANQEKSVSKVIPETIKKPSGTIPKTLAAPKEVSALPKTIARPVQRMKLSDVKPEALRLSGQSGVSAPSSPSQDVRIPQTVSDRNLAHIASGGIGFNSK